MHISGPNALRKTSHHTGPRRGEVELAFLAGSDEHVIGTIELVVLRFVTNGNRAVVLLANWTFRQTLVLRRKRDYADVDVLRASTIRSVKGQT
jgi:hypothetical protein